MIILFFCVLGISATFVIGTIICIAFGLVDKFVMRFGKAGKIYGFVSRNSHRLLIGGILASIILFVAIGAISTYDILEASIKAYLPKWY